MLQKLSQLRESVQSTFKISLLLWALDNPKLQPDNYTGLFLDDQEEPVAIHCAVSLFQHILNGICYPGCRHN